jgi:hypothetical protein
MKSKALSLIASLFFVAGSTAFSADIPITGETWGYGGIDYTYYATPPTPIAPGTTYAWEVYDATIVAQNTDPAAGPLYITLRWDHVLMQASVGIADNMGNTGILFVIVNGFAATALQDPFGANGKEGRNGFKAAYTYSWHEAICPGDKKKAIQKRPAIA